MTTAWLSVALLDICHQIVLVFNLVVVRAVIWERRTVYSRFFVHCYVRTSQSNDNANWARVTGQFIVRLILFSIGNCPLDWNSIPMFYANPSLQKNIQS